MAEPPTQTLHVNTQIVLLDVAVVDKKGHPAAVALGRDDFTITEDGKPQRLLSFEPPASRAAAATAVFVLDELNTSAADRGYYLVCLEQYLRSSPAVLPIPTELMVLSASSLKIVQPATQSRADLLATVLHWPASGDTLVNLEPDRFSLTLNALQLIAAESLGGAGKTAVVWLGPGNGVDLNSQPITKRPETNRYIRYMTNTLLESRTTLYVIFPPGVAGEDSSFIKGIGSRDLSVAGPFDGGINFVRLAAQTGGSVYTATNDLAAAMRKSLELGRGAYTMSYHPAEAMTDGRFRQIRVTLRDPTLRVVTKSGYYAPEVQEQNAPQTIQIFQMVEAGRSTLPFRGLTLRVTHINRSRDAKSTNFTVSVNGKDLPWRPEGQEESLAELTVGGLSFSKDGKKLSSHFENANMMSHSQDATVLEKKTVSFNVTLAVPSNTERVRLVVSSRKNGRLGCVDINRSELSAAIQPTAAAIPGL